MQTVNPLTKVKLKNGIYSLDLDAIEFMHADYDKMEIEFISKNNNMMTISYANETKERLEEDFNDIYVVYNKFKTEVQKMIQIIG